MLEQSYNLDTLNIVDYAIAIQLSKIEKYEKRHKSSELDEQAEYAMSNLIELLDLRLRIK